MPLSNTEKELSPNETFSLEHNVDIYRELRISILTKYSLAPIVIANAAHFVMLLILFAVYESSINGVRRFVGLALFGLSTSIVSSIYYTFLLQQYFNPNIGSTDSIFYTLVYWMITGFLVLWTPTKWFFKRELGIDLRLVGRTAVITDTLNWAIVLLVIAVGFALGGSIGYLFVGLLT